MTVIGHLKTKSQAQQEIDKAKKKLAQRQAAGNPSPKLKGRIADLRKTRMSLPKVNPDPRPPNEPKPKPPATPPGGSPQTPPQGSATPPPGLEIGGFPLPSFTPGEGQMDPRDPEYWVEIGKIRANANLQLVTGPYGVAPADYVEGGIDQDLARKMALHKQLMGFRKDWETRDINVGANRAGAFYSSATGEAQNRANLARQAETAGLQLEIDDIDRMREAAKQAVAMGIPFDDFQAILDAIARSTERLESAPPPPGQGGKGKPSLSAREKAQYKQLVKAGKKKQAKKYATQQSGKDPFKAKPKATKGGLKLKRK